MHRIDFHFVAASQGPYPVNAMRNVAIDHARTRFVLLADIDFFPSDSISELAEQWSQKYFCLLSEVLSFVAICRMIFEFLFIELLC
jgi:hypothetical protein